MVAKAPHGWGIVALGEVAEAARSQCMPQKDDVRPYIALENLAQGTPRLLGWSVASKASSTKAEFRAGDVLYGKLRPNLCKAVLVPFDGVCSTDILVLRSLNESLDQSFLLHLTHSAAFRNYAVSTASGTKMPRTSWGLLSGFELFLPTLAEQKKIANILSSIDETIQKTEAVIEHLHVVKQTAMREVFECLQDASGWGVLEISQAGTWLSGGTPKKDNVALWSGSIPWVSPKDMKRPIISEAIDHVSDAAVGAGTRLVPAGTILIVVRGMILAHSFPVALTRTPVCFNQDIKALRPSTDFEPEFLLHWLTYSGPTILALTDASTHGTRRIPTEALFSIKVPVPPRQEQVKIATFLTSIDDLAEANRCEVVALKTLKKGLLSRLLSGEIRVQPDEPPA